MNPGTEAHPFRVAIIGAGPAGFYAAAYLLKQNAPVFSVDLYDQLPTPYGLVRYGVAPDHEKIRNVIRVYDKTAAHPRFRFFGNVALGTHVQVDDLRAHYHQVVYTTGAQVDRRLGIPGEDLPRSYSATEFVAWYNGHPHYRDCVFDLSQERVVVVGVGNVAVDVARILCRTPEELATTDMADYALEALRESKVKEVVMMGRRGPAQAAFTNPEIKEMGEMEDADIYIPRDEALLDPLSQSDLDANPDRLTQKKVDLIQTFAERTPSGKSKRLTLRFLVSPVEILPGPDGGVTQVKVVKNTLYRTDDGRLRPRATETSFTLDAGVVFRSVGYRGVALPGVPFHARWGTIENEQGRVIDPAAGHAPVPGAYTAGWIKRGPSGVIGTNKGDAVESMQCLIADAEAGDHLHPTATDGQAIASLIQQRQPDVITYEDWLKVNAIETEKGEAQGRPRVKFTSTAELLSALGRVPASQPS